MRALIRDLNWMMGSSERAADSDVESATDNRDEGFCEHSEADLLAFFDTLPANPACWDERLEEQSGVRVPREAWVRLSASFDLLAGEREALAVPHAIVPLSVVERVVPDVLVIEDTGCERPAIAEKSSYWLTRLELERVECSDPRATDSPRIALEDVGCGGGKPVVARYYGKQYWTPAPDMLEPVSPGWTPPRHRFAAIFAGDLDSEYFRGLATPAGEKHPDWYWVRRELPCVVALLLWADPQEEWAKNAARRFEADCVAIPKAWYDDFAERAPAWLRLWRPSEIAFGLRIANPVATRRTYRAEMLAKCVILASGARPRAPPPPTSSTVVAINGSVH